MSEGDTVWRTYIAYQEAYVVIGRGIPTNYMPSTWLLSYALQEHDRGSTVLRKPGNDDYTQPRAYRPIALLNTLGKVMEAILHTDFPI